MTDKLIVQLLPPIRAADDEGSGVIDCAAQWLRLAGDEAPAASSPEAGTLAELLQMLPGNCRWIVLLPGENVLTTAVRLPRKRRRQALKALPFMLEDSIASDVMQEHAAVGPDNPDGATLVAVTHKQQLRELLETFAAAGVTPYKVLPDYAALRESPDSWQILLDGDRALVRRPDGTGFTTPVSRLALLLNAEQGADKDAPEKKLNCFRAADASVPELPGDWQISEQVVANPLQHLADGAAQASLNLLQGEFKTMQKDVWNWRPWAAAAVLALVAICIGLFETGLETARYNRENEQLQASMMELARDALPGLTQIRDPQAQLLIAWRQLKNGGAGEAEFLPLLNRVSPAISQQQVTVQGISFRDGTLTMALQGTSLQQLDDLRQQIEQQGLDASLINAGTDADSAHSSLVIKAGNLQQHRGAG